MRETPSEVDDWNEPHAHSIYRHPYVLKGVCSTHGRPHLNSHNAHVFTIHAHIHHVGFVFIICAHPICFMADMLLHIWAHVSLILCLIRMASITPYFHDLCRSSLSHIRPPLYKPRTCLWIILLHSYSHAYLYMLISHVTYLNVSHFFV